MKRSQLTSRLLLLFIMSLTTTPIAFPSADVIVHGQRIGFQRSMLVSQQHSLTSNEIEKLAIQDINEALQFIPGVTLQRSGGVGHQSSFRIRGSETGQVLVLIDGMQMNDPISTSGLFTGDFLSLANIESIKVIKGPQALAYGPRALGGVIVIKTRSGQELQKLDSAGEVSLELGNQKYLGFDANIRTRTQDTYGAVAIDYRETDGFNITSKTSVKEPSLEGAQISSGHAHYGREFGKVSFHQVLHISKSESDLDKGFGDERDAIGWNQERDIIHTKSHLSTENFLSFDLIQMGIHYGKNERKNNNPAQETSENDQEFEYSSEVLNIDFFLQKILSKNLEILLSLEWLHQRGSFREDLGNNLITEKNNQSDNSFGLGVALNYQRPINSDLEASLSIGARIEDHSNYGSTPQYSIMPSLYVRPINSIFNIKATVGKNNPSLYQLYSQYGNTELTPEKVVLLELNWEAEINSSLSLGAGLFRNQHYDLIDIVFDPTENQMEYVNQHKWSNKGAELWAMWRHQTMDNTTLHLTSAHLKSKSMQGSIDRPKHTASARLNRQMNERLELNAQLFYKSRRSSGHTLSPEELPSYYTVGVGALYSKENSRLSLKVLNALDKKYEDIAGYNANERSFRLRYTYHF